MFFRASLGRKRVNIFPTNQMTILHVGSTGGVSPARNMWSVFFRFGGGGGGGVSFILVTTRVHRLRTSLVHPVLLGSLGHDSFAGRPACLGLQDMTGSTLEVCLCLSLVLLLRLVGLRCPSPNEHLKVFFTTDPFLLDAHIDVCTRASDPTISFVQEVALLNCRSRLRFDRLLTFRLVLFDVWTSHFHRHHMSFTPVMWSALWVLSRRLLQNRGVQLNRHVNVQHSSTRQPPMDTPCVTPAMDTWDPDPRERTPRRTTQTTTPVLDSPELASKRRELQPLIDLTESPPRSMSAAQTPMKEEAFPELFVTFWQTCEHISISLLFSETSFL